MVLSVFRTCEIRCGQAGCRGLIIHIEFDNPSSGEVVLGGTVLSLRTPHVNSGELSKRLIFVFLFGAIVGAGGLYGALSYHIVCSEVGFHFILKISQQLNETYIDIRQFDLANGSEPKTLSASIVTEEKLYLMNNSIDAALHQAVDRVIELVPRS